MPRFRNAVQKQDRSGLPVSTAAYVQLTIWLYRMTFIRTHLYHICCWLRFVCFRHDTCQRSL